MSTLITALVVSGMIGAASSTPWNTWATSDEGRPGHIDHSTWQVMLNRYLDARHRSGIARFRYAEVTPAHRALLAGYVTTLTSIDPRDYARAEQKAYWINLYNARTALFVIDNPDVDSIRDIRPHWFSSGPWGVKDLRIGDDEVSLDDIEHRILRPLFGDRRIHYALNCASLGCPDLSAKVFTGKNVEMRLAAAEEAFVNHPRAVRFDGEVLVLSSLYDWYRDDFAPNERTLLDYLADHHLKLGDRLRAHTGAIRYEYDWALNRP